MSLCLSLSVLVPSLALFVGAPSPEITAQSSPSVAAPERYLPDFAEDRPEYWLNSGPLQVAELRGSVLLVEVWTFGCGNCTRTIPWIRDLAARYAEQGLLILGVHSPEFSYEREIRRVRAFAEEREITYPILLDNDHRYWTSLANQYWPTIYLVDRKGFIRHIHVGETHSGTKQAARIETIIEALLAEG